MKIIIIGCGKSGFTIAKVMSEEKGIDVTVVDNDPDVFENLVESIDVIPVTGNGVNEKTLVEAGAKDADLVVSTTHADELNILCCIMAERLGTRHSIARVRSPEYSSDYNRLWKDLGIDMIINPEQQTAREISRLLRYPSASEIDTFVNGRVEMVSVKASENPEYFAGKTVAQLFNDKMGLLLAVIEREGTAIIPNGDFVFNDSDVMKILGRPSDIMNFFSNLKRKPKSQEVMVIGGGRTTRYLAELLDRHTIKTNIKIIEKDREKCEALDESLSKINRRCLVINADGTNEDVLTTESINQTDAFICLTDRDEENAIISLYALRMGVKKVITKVNYIHQNMIKNLGLGLGNIITPQNITTDIIMRFVTGLTGAVGSSIRTAHRISSGAGGAVDAIEFHVNNKAKGLGIPIKSLNLKKEILIGCIVRDSEIIIPSGKSRIQADDSVIVIAKNNEVYDFDDILSNKAEIVRAE